MQRDILELKFEDHLVSFYQSKNAKENTRILLSDIIEEIRGFNYSSIIKKCRTYFQANDLSKYDELKSKLPAYTFSGVFQGPHKKETIEVYNNTMVIDIDKLDDVLIEGIKTELFKDDFVFAIWKSPSGNGLKVLIKTNTPKELHKYVFDEAVNYFEEEYKIVIDKSGSDYSRLCYVSHDEELMFKTISKIFNPEIRISTDKKLSVKDEAIDQNIQSPNNHLSNSNFAKTEGKNKREERIMIERVIKFLRKNNFSITATYENWYRVALAIANAFTYDVGRKYYMELCRFDGVHHNEYKSEMLLEYCYRNRKEGRISFRTIVHFAKEKGFVIK
jgi:hypothetical protein